MNAIQSGIPSAGRAMGRDEPGMQESANGKREPDTEAATELFHRYAPALFAYLRQHTASREDAEDLLHEVFAATLERPEFGQLGDNEQALWLWRVTRNKTVDTYRRKTRRPSLTLDYVADELYSGDEQSPEYAHLLATALKAITLHSHQMYMQPGDGKAEVYWNGQLVTTLHFVVTQKPQKP